MKKYRIVDSGNLKTPQEWLNDANIKDLNRMISHAIPLKMTMEQLSGMGIVVSEETRKYIHDRLWMNLYGEAIEREVSSARLKEIMDAFEDKTWPTLMEALGANQGAMQFMKEFGVWSPRVISFLIDSWEHPGLAMLPACCLGHDPISDDIVMITPNDALFAFHLDQTFRMINYRQSVERQIISDPSAKLIAMMGGGLLLSLLTYGYAIGHDGQKVIAYDKDPCLIPYIEKILGGKLEDFGIEYHIGDFAELLQDETQYNRFDAVLYGGLLTYNISQLNSIVAQSYKLLRNGGTLYGDLQIFGDGPEGAEPTGLAKLIYGFDGYVIRFPKMDILPSDKDAKKAMVAALSAAGFNVNNAEFTTEPYDKTKGESPAGLITVAIK